MTSDDKTKERVETPSTEEESSAQEALTTLSHIAANVMAMVPDAAGVSVELRDDDVQAPVFTLHVGSQANLPAVEVDEEGQPTSLNVPVDPIDLLVLRGNQRLEAEEFAEAVQAFTEAIEHRPDDPELLNNRAIAHVMLAHFDEALADYEAALVLRPDDPKLFENRGKLRFQMGDDQGFLDDLTKANELCGGQEPLYLMRMGQVHYGRDEIDQALAMFDAAITLDPDLPDIYFHKGKALLHAGKWELAIDVFGQDLAQNEISPISFWNRHIAFRRVGAIDDAIADLSSAIAVAAEADDLPPAPRLSHFHIERAHLLGALDQIDEAIEDLEAAMELEPDNVDWLEEYASFCIQHQLYEAAIEGWGAVLVVSPESLQARIGRAMSFTFMEKFDRALQEHQAAIQLEPKNPVLYNNRGYTLQCAGDLQGAILEYDKAIELDSTYEKAYTNRAALHKECGNLSKARADYLFLQDEMGLDVTAALKELAALAED